MTPYLSRRFPNNDLMLRYDHFPHAFFSDTFIAGSVSKRGNKYVQMYGASFGWTRAFPMAKKGNTYETLSLLFKRDGVPPETILDGSKEHISGKFNKKLKEANCHLRQTDTYSPWSNAAEGTICETKKVSSRKIICTGSPNKLRNRCLELEALICLNNALDIYMIDGEVPETVMKEQASDISNFCEFSRYQWVRFHEVPVQYPVGNLVLGRYLGPAQYVGTEMTSKTLKANGEIFP